MAKVKITGHASGSGILTITAPNTSTDRTITLPDATGTLLNSDGDGSNLTGIVGVPTGVITMWHGASGAIPSGWVICDGNNSTPNLTDKFIKSTGTASQTGGGTTSGAHTLSTAEMPSHVHTMNVGGTAYQANQPLGHQYYNATRDTLATGGGGSHTHSQAEPVYFSLIFIMKT
jgi:hypothetical protein